MKLGALVLLGLLGVVGCAGGSENPGSMQVKTTSAMISSMTGHKTYAFESVAPAPPGDAQWSGAPALIADVKQNIDADMQAKGYVLSPDPEMLIRISIGVRKTIDVPTGTTERLGAPEKQETVTDLHIDVFDRANNGHLFHGTASNQLHHDEPGANKLAKAVRLILEAVPNTSPPTVALAP